ncbi:MAG: glycine cleavage T C-terminal barrel domain-containing protein [Vampirovibrionales bacterium]
MNRAAATSSGTTLFEQVTAARHPNAVSWHWLHNRAPMGRLVVSGPDAATFLEAQSTMDLMALAIHQGVGEGQLTTYLDRKAGIRVMGALLRTGQTEFTLIAPPAFSEALATVFEQVHFAEDLTLSFSQGPVLSVQGGGLSQLHPTMAPLGNWASAHVDVELGTTAPLLKVGQPTTGEPGLWFVGSESDLDRLVRHLINDHQAVELSLEAVEVLRVEAGWLAAGVDILPGTPLTNTGLQHPPHQCISYTKGCFPGQEVVAKVKTTGSAPKSLVGLVLPSHQFEAPAPMPTGAEVWHNEQVIGTVTSSVVSPTLDAVLCIVSMKRDWRVPGKHLNVVIAGNPYLATVTFLPFYQRTGQAEQARAAYEAGLDAFGASDEAEAERLFRQAIAFDPRLADAYESLGVLLGRHQQYDEAVELMKQLAELDPDCVMARANLSLYYMKLGMIDAAEQEKAEATRLQFSQQVARQMAEQQAAMARQAEADEQAQRLAMFEEVLALDPDDLVAGYGLGSLYLARGAFEQAVACLSHNIEVDAGHSVSYLALGQAYEGMGNSQKAEAVYEAGVAVASRRGDMRPLSQMQTHLARLRS